MKQIAEKVLYHINEAIQQLHTAKSLAKDCSGYAKTIDNLLGYLESLSYCIEEEWDLNNELGTEARRTSSENRKPIHAWPDIESEPKCVF